MTWGPLGWLGRAFRVPGTERRTLAQAVKAAVAAVGAWLVTAEFLGLTQPFLAPYAAVFLIEATVYRSLRSWAQQVGAVAVGVLLAAAAGQWIPSITVGIGVTVLVGLLIGNWSIFGEAGQWIGITGMLLVSYGTATQGVLLADRLLEIALGAAIGTAVNALILPPLYGERAREATQRLGRQLADVVAALAEAVRGEDAGDWQRMARDAESLVRRAEEASGRAREGKRLNVRKRAFRLRAHEDWFEPPLVALRESWRHIDHLVAAIRTMTEQGDEPLLDPSAPRADFAVLLDEIAETIRLRVDPECAPERLSEHLERCRSRVDEVHRSLTGPTDHVASLGALVLPARHILRHLTPSR
ncbi:FUSC family protein [Amycolatopsis anabasis]|uniref:FUSC family protein n=1 Tax=Amycolatopsis anabasis TaxID=1840409 RepID=UPI00131A9D58|nr:aromatic acid exporter family protein [Amycolatopsis anabasis]